jgi:4-carboxymuconolactone decarboxylase
MRPPNAITTFMHHPALTGPWLRYNAQLLQRPALDPRHRELVVLRVAWRAKAQYEWVQHIRLATRYGITAEEIEAVTRSSSFSPSDGEWSALEADLLTATDELLDDFRIRDETWKRLAEQLDVKQLLELLFVAGTYTTLAMVFNSLGVELDPELDPASGPAIPVRTT